jgi:hypothetical protein
MNKFVNLPDELNDVAKLVIRLITPSREEGSTGDVTESDIIACLDNTN